MARSDLEFRLGKRRFGSNLGQIGHGAGVFDELLEGGHDGGASEEFAEEVDLAAKFIVGNGLDEFLGGGTGYGVVLDDLRSSRARDPKRFAFTGKLRNEADGLGTRSVDGSSGKEQIAPSGENGLLRADKNADRSLRGQRFERSNKLLQFGEHGGANFVGRSMIKGQFDYAFAPFPAQRPAGEISHFHACCLLAASRTAFESYMALISAA